MNSIQYHSKLFSSSKKNFSLSLHNPSTWWILYGEILMHCRHLDVLKLSSSRFSFSTIIGKGLGGDDTNNGCIYGFCSINIYLHWDSLQGDIRTFRSQRICWMMCPNRIEIINMLHENMGFIRKPINIPSLFRRRRNKMLIEFYTKYSAVNTLNCYKELHTARLRVRNNVAGNFSHTCSRATFVCSFTQAI